MGLFPFYVTLTFQGILTLGLTYHEALMLKGNL